MVMLGLLSGGELKAGTNLGPLLFKRMRIEGTVSSWTADVLLTVQASDSVVLVLACSDVEISFDRVSNRTLTAFQHGSFT